MNNPDYMLRRCNQCPGKEALVDFIQNLPQMSRGKGRNMVQKMGTRNGYKKWVSRSKRWLHQWMILLLHAVKYHLDP